MASSCRHDFHSVSSAAVAACEQGTSISSFIRSQRSLATNYTCCRCMRAEWRQHVAVRVTIYFRCATTNRAMICGTLIGGRPRAQGGLLFANSPRKTNVEFPLCSTREFRGTQMKVSMSDSSTVLFKQLHC